MNLKNKKIIFFGFSDLGFKCLEFLINEGYNVVAVFTHQTDEHEEEWFQTAESLAKKHNIEVYKPESLKSEKYLKIVEELEPDLILSLYYRNFIPENIFSQAKLGAYNMHGSYLPTYRGRAPLNWAIINGENYTGVSLHVLEKDFDTGDIVAQEKVIFDDQEYVADIQKRVSQAGLRVLKNNIDDILNSKLNLIKQDHSKASYFGKRTPKDGKIDFSKSAIEVFNLIRALSKPFPGAFCELADKNIIIWKAKILEEKPNEAKAGQIISQNPLKIACNDKVILVQEYQDL